MMKRIKPSFRVGLLALSAALLTGCWHGPAEVQLQTGMGPRPLFYEVFADGLLRVTDASVGRAAPQQRELLAVQLDERSVRRLSDVVWDSGFLFDTRDVVETPDGGGPLMIGAKIGMFSHRMNIRSGQVPSVLKIVAELNTHLPPELQIPYRREEDQWLRGEDAWMNDIEREMRQYD